MKGRKPKPTAIQINAGDPSRIGVRKLRQKLEAEPKAAKGLPPRPEHLAGRSKAAWDFWAEELEAMGLDRRPDAMMLEGACVGYSRAVSADLLIEEDGAVILEPIVDRKSGVIVGHTRKTHPAVAISKDAWAQVRAFCCEFGLSPVSRTRLSIERKDDAEQDLMAILSKPREPRQTVN